MRARSLRAAAALLAGLGLISIGLSVIPAQADAAIPADVSAADTTTSTTTPDSSTSPCVTSVTGTLVGAGSTFALPAVDQVENDNGLNLGDLFPNYEESLGLDGGRVAVADGQADFGVVQAPLTGSAPAEPGLTPDEVGLAQSCGRSVAYVPFAADAVAVAAVVESNPCGSTAATCPLYTNIQVSVPTLASILTSNVGTWTDKAFADDGNPPIESGDQAIRPWFAFGPDATNAATITYLLTNPAAAAIWNAYAARPLFDVPTNTPLYYWPNVQLSVGQQDDAVQEQLVPLNVATHLPDDNHQQWDEGGLGLLPYSFVLPSGIPTMAVANPAGAFVQPSPASMAAAMAHTSMDSDNLVTFNADTAYQTDKAEYPIMVMSYIAAPTSGLTPDKATALASFIRFVLSAAGQADVTSSGYQPVTPAMIAAGDQVADTVAAEATPPPTTTTTAATTTTTPATTTIASTTTSATTTTTTGSVTATTVSTGNGGGVASSGGGSSVSGGGSLPFTGTKSGVLFGSGLVLLAGGESLRRVARRRQSLSGWPTGGWRWRRDRGGSGG